ncbi:MAG: phosphatase PAP2 family protein [Chloroflexota bacterium]
MTPAAPISSRASAGPVPSPSEPVWKRASGTEIALLGGYFFALIAITDILNVRLGVEILTCAVIFAAIAISRLPLLFVRDWWFFLIGLIMWNLSGPIAANSTFPLHLDFMLNIDKWLFFGNDPVVLVQQHLAPSAHISALDVITSIGYNLHLTEPYVIGYFLWRLNRGLYLQFAAAALILLVLGLITFILFPAIPPWMASARLHRIPDVVNRFGLTLHWHPLPFHGTPIFYLFTFRGDAVAAFPSEHAAFPLLELLVISRLRNRVLTLAFSLWVLWVAFTVVYLGEHWVADVLAGYVYAIVIFLAVRWFTRSRRSPAQAV